MSWEPKVTESQGQNNQEPGPLAESLKLPLRLATKARQVTMAHVAGKLMLLKGEAL